MRVSILFRCMARHGFVWFALLAMSGWASTSLDGSLMPGVVIGNDMTYYVEKFEPDNRGLQDVIRDQLVALGRDAKSGRRGRRSP